MQTEMGMHEALHTNEGMQLFTENPLMPFTRHFEISTMTVGLVIGSGSDRGSFGSRRSSRSSCSSSGSSPRRRRSSSSSSSQQQEENEYAVAAVGARVLCVLLWHRYQQSRKMAVLGAK